MRIIFFSFLIFTSLLTSCCSHKSYVPPSLDIPYEWNSPLSDGMHTNSPKHLIWWESLNDPILNRLIKLAAFQNLDLYLAGTRILEARLQRKGKNSDLYPHVDMSCSYSHIESHQNVVLSRILKHSQNKLKTNSSKLNLFEIGFDADWEIDLFQSNQYEMNALEAQIEANEENFNDIWVTLSAEIGRNYIELRHLQHKLILLNKQIESQADTLHLTEELLQIGMANSIDILTATQQLATLKARKPAIEFSIQKTIYHLSILLGQFPGEVEELLKFSNLPCLPVEKPIGIPSELLRRRPDIRRAERQLATATESIGSAEAALFPKLSLKGFVGMVTPHLKSLLNPTMAGTWFANPQLLMPIFNSRLLKRDVDYHKLKTKQALFEYQKTVLEALEETENAIASFHYELERHQQLSVAYSAAQEAQRGTLELYLKGFKNYLEVQFTNRALIELEEASNESQMQLILHYIALYKSLGGGWNFLEDTKEQPS
ncbi:efflux transporter outer membrane subunit [Candidatus Protochlamydia amoebophila]|uniref:Putative outer membrane protein of AcrAB(MexAB)-OprM multidrug efflux pump n=1 Tax=Candidatus Protochlamydia amoebophila TaxID=362787 RepID=A0A0C1JVT0_9BACT|nr:efflux transporter outer membrane subunit [Candidatus Protochlamydia amoebophila]KIC71362.1 putative outer membrane protein of AcrAB(MexAB)-OprM multidrug efflux pump [Candidatus Protochlamydia amoebophila]